MKAPAKINLLLRVLSIREDGKHEIESVMQAIDCYDEVEIETIESGESSYKIVCKTEGVSLPEDEENLAYRAAQIFLERYKINCIVNIRLAKHIPVAAGLAGGSADAAAVLLALAAKYAPERPLTELADLGVKLGADVPFQIYTCAGINPSLGFKEESFFTAVASGIGEKLTPVYPAKIAYVLLVNPGVLVSAGEAYHLFDSTGKTSEIADANTMAAKLRSGDESSVLSFLLNDLMSPVADKYPEVKNLITRMTSLCESRGGKAMMSGSGSTVFGLFYDKQAAQEAYDEARSAFPDMFCVLARTV